MPGGYLKEFSMSLVGPLAERNLKQLSCNKLFLGVDSIKPDKGVFTHHIEEAQLNQLMINLTEEVILVSDSSKFAKSGMAFICECDHIHKLITDDGIPDEHLKALEKHNVEVIVV
jgi:DeoR family transcriptional regulator of aga operon